MTKHKPKLSLGLKLIVWIALMVFFVLLLAGAMLITSNVKHIEENIRDNALFIARVIAKAPSVQRALLSENPSLTLQPYAEQCRLATGAAFVVISNMDSIRFSHPIAEKIGTPMSDLYREPVLKGEEYIHIGQGALAPALRVNVPVFSPNDSSVQIGYVTVGFFLDEIDKMTANNIRKILTILLIALVLGIISAILLAKNVKRAIFDLEPWEIAAIAEDRRVILEAIREGVVAIDINKQIRLINKHALELVGLKEEEALGAPLKNILPSNKIDAVLSQGQKIYDEEQFVGQAVFLTNTVPITFNKEVAGAVITFRDRTEMIRLAEELTGVNKLIDTHRTQSHEFKNKLHTISGLIQLKKYDEATELLTKYSEVSSEIFSKLQADIDDSLTYALLTGKASRCAELGITFTISPGSSLTRLPGRLSSGDMVVILGNLLENAMEAVKDVKLQEIYLILKENSAGLHIIIQNSGSWIPENLGETIYEKGMSTKGLNRGIGLALVKEKITANNGSIDYCNLPKGGVEFRVFIPADNNGRGDLDA